MKAELAKLFYYDPSSPSFLRWGVDRMSGRGRGHPIVKRGDIAGTISSNGRYYDTYFERKLWRVHKIIAILHGMAIPDDFRIDHIDGNSLNNEISNLRLLTQADNCKNRKKQHNNTSGSAGVSKKPDAYGNMSWTARWQTRVGHRATKSFSTVLYGEEEALKKAIEYRNQMIEQLKSQGHAYTIRHGK